jgi:hypothetical protein
MLGEGLAVLDGEPAAAGDVHSASATTASAARVRCMASQPLLRWAWSPVVIAVPVACR